MYRFKKLKKIIKISPHHRDALRVLLSKKIDRYIPSITFLTDDQQEIFKKKMY